MRAWRVHDYGDPSGALQLDDVPDPTPAPGQVSVRVAAAAVNFPDVLLCRGGYQERPDLPFTPGVEVCGVVDAVGESVAQVAVGDRVIALPPPPYGGMAERLVVDQSVVMSIPEGMPDHEAAAFNLTYHTAHVSLHRRARLQEGEVVLVHGGAGGVGSAAIDLAVCAGATVIATAGGAEKTAVCRELGAHHVIDYTDGGFIDAVKQITDGRGADVILDPVGGSVFDDSRRCVAFEGRIVVIGFASGEIPQAPANHVLVKNYAVVGMHHGLYRRKDPALVNEVHEELCRLAEAGAIKPLVRMRFPFEQAADAVQALADRKAIGKVVIDVAQA